MRFRRLWRDVQQRLRWRDIADAGIKRGAGTRRRGST